MEITTMSNVIGNMIQRQAEALALLRGTVRRYMMDDAMLEHALDLIDEIDARGYTLADLSVQACTEDRPVANLPEDRAGIILPPGFR